MNSQDNKSNESDSIKKELVTITKGTGFSFFGSIAGKGLKFLIITLLTRALGASLYGIYTLGLTIINFISKITTLGLDKGALKYIASFHGKGDDRKTKGIVLTAVIIPFILSVGISLLLYFYAENIALFFNKPLLSQALKPLAISLPFLALLSTLSASTQGFKTTKYRMLGNIIVRDIIQLIFIISFYLFGYKLLGMIWAFIFGVIAGTLVLFYYLNKLFPQLTSNKVKPKFKNKKLFCASLPLMHIGILSLIVGWSDVLMLGYFVSAEEIGIYKIAVTISALIVIFFRSLISIFSPIISEYYHQNRHKALNSIFKTVAKWNFALSLPIFLTIIISSQDLLRLFGSNFAQGNIPLLILAFTKIFKVMIFGSAAVLAMTAYHNINALISTFGIIANIILNYIFIVKLSLGIQGAAIATAITFALITLSRTLFSFLKLNLSPFSKQTINLIFIGGGGTIISFFIKNIFLINAHYLTRIIVVGLTLVLIFGATISFWGNKKNDKFILKKILTKIKR